MAGPARRTTGSTMPDRASFFGMETSSATGRSSRHPLSWQLRRFTKSRKLWRSGTTYMHCGTSMSRRCGSGEP